jgi:2-dehydropantoate 2-reductase
VVLTAMNGVPWWFLHGFGGRLAGVWQRSAAFGDAQHVPSTSQQDEF